MKIKNINHIVISDIVERHGAHGEMHSLYLRDPNGNLVELTSYNSK